MSQSVSESALYRGKLPQFSATLPKKRAGACTPALSQILGEDRHVGVIVVHCNKTNCNRNFVTNGDCPKLCPAAAAIRAAAPRSPPVLPV
jgi:hypothetical protein